MMDPNIGWYQSEHNGPALELWKKIWSDFNKVEESHKKIGPNLSTNYCNFLTQFCKLYNKKENPSSTYDMNNNQHLIQKYNGTPWRSLSTYYGREMEGLHQEIIDFYTYMKPTIEEIGIRIEVLKRITAIIKKLWPEVKVHCFGSYQTETFLPTSDIDIVAIGDWHYSPLNELAQHLIVQGQCQARDMRVLDRAAIPIIKMTDNQSGIRINISFNVPDVCKSVQLVKNFIKEFPNLKPLLYVIKQFVLQRDLNEVFRGGLSSYSLVLMIVHFFQMNPELQFKSDPENANLGVVLLRFLELYGKKLNYEKVGLRIKDGGAYVKKSELLKNMESRREPPLLCIEDPLNLTNNVSKNSYAVEKIRDSFDYAFDVLYRAVGPNSPAVDQTMSILGRIIRITDEVIDRRLKVCHKYIELNLIPNLKFTNGLNGNNRPQNGWKSNKTLKKNSNQWNRNNHWNHNPTNRRFQSHNIPTGSSGIPLTQQLESDQGFKDNRNGFNNRRFTNGTNGYDGQHNHHNYRNQHNHYSRHSFYSFERCKDSEQRAPAKRDQRYEYFSGNRKVDCRSDVRLRSHSDAGLQTWKQN